VPQIPLEDALAEVRALLLDPDRLVRAVGSGRRRGARPDVARVELRPVDVRGRRHLQLVRRGDEVRTDNVAFGADARAAVDALLAEPYGSWHVDATDATVQLRVTKSGAAVVHRAGGDRSQDTAHDRAARHLLDPGDPLFTALGAGGDKRRQVDAFLRVLAGALDDVDLPTDRPLRVVDLGCGNAYLTFGAYAYLAQVRGLDVELVGVDVREPARRRSTALAERLGWADHVRFQAGTILDADVPAPDVVLALHACDTATDEALARAVGWDAALVLAAPCCHRDVAAQIRRGSSPAAPLLVRDGILRERFADVLTDALRAGLLRRRGYRVDVVEFVPSRHTPRNSLIRAVRTGRAGPSDDGYEELLQQWGVRPRLAELLDA
jgi:SAM-dependent methyltransferase